MSKAIDDLNWWKKQMPEWIFGMRKTRKESERNINEINERNLYLNTDEMTSGAREALKIGNNILDQMQDKQDILIYWEDSNGIHSYYTDEISIS